MIEIKRNGKVFYTLEDVCEGSKLSMQLMEHHYIVLKFTTVEPVYFEIGDSVEIPDFGYFELTSAYFPKQGDDGGYDYELQLDAYYMAWKNKICKYRPQFGACETSFSLTTNVSVHANVILNNLKALGLTYNGDDFSVDYTTYNKDTFDVEKRFLVSYDSISILDALETIAESLECEWWIDGSVIYLGTCEMIGQVTFEQGVNVKSMTFSESEATYITRLYAFGSDRNIPKGYFTGSETDVTTDGIATDYLMLPDQSVDVEGFVSKDGYLENVNVVKNPAQAIEGVVRFDDEYPKVECAVSGIKTYDSTVKNDDGSTTTQTFWQITSVDSFAKSFELSWVKPNLTLSVKFTSGALLGMEFEVAFKVIEKVNYFEIVANDNYGRTLPDKSMCPKTGDKFFLYNWDSSKITDTDLIKEAQSSLLERAKTYYTKSMVSNANFECEMDADRFFNHGTYDYHPLGEQVKLINPMFSDTDEDGNHYRNSRIIGMEIALDIPYDAPTYIVGEKASYSKLGQLEDKVDSITVNGMQIGGNGAGGGVYIIGVNDSTPATDENVYSARRSRLNFLSRVSEDEAHGLITFARGLVAKEMAKLKAGLQIGETFASGMLTGIGAQIDKAGNAVLESLTVRSSMTVKELIYNRLTATEGSYVFSESGTIESVKVNEPAEEGGNTTYDLTLKKRWENDFTAFQENDVLLASINDLTNSGKYYDCWLRVVDVKTSANRLTCVLYDDDETPSGENHAPGEMMMLIRWGNAVDETRQSLWYLSSTEQLFCMLNHVTKPIIDKTNYSMALGTLPKSLEFIFQNYPQADKGDSWGYMKGLAVEELLRVDYQGNVVATELDRGTWSEETAKGDEPYRLTEGRYDTVWHYGCQYKCIKDKTTEEPGWASKGWAFRQGNPEFKAEMTSTEGWSFDADLIQKKNDVGYVAFTTLGVDSSIYNKDVSGEIGDDDYMWTRNTGDTLEDNAWAAKHSKDGRTVSITYDDLGTNAEARKLCTFQCTVTLRNEKTAVADIVINY